MKQQIWEAMEEMQGKIAAEIRVMLKEPPIDPKNFGPESQARRIKAMQECCATSETDEERHEKWMQQHIADGWTEGEYSEEAKTHPNLLPWECLPRPVQAKARIFDIVAKTARTIEGMFNALPQLNPPATSDNPPEMNSPVLADTQIPPDLV